jgi:hypothetical protein
MLRTAAMPQNRLFEIIATPHSMLGFEKGVFAYRRAGPASTGRQKGSSRIRQRTRNEKNDKDCTSHLLPPPFAIASLDESCRGQNPIVRSVILAGPRRPGAAHRQDVTRARRGNGACLCPKMRRTSSSTFGKNNLLLYPPSGYRFPYRPTNGRAVCRPAGEQPSASEATIIAPQCGPTGELSIGSVGRQAMTDN